MAWWKREKSPRKEEWASTQMPDDLWLKCPSCAQIIYKKEVDKNLKVCPKCSYHFRISVAERILLTLDEGTFQPFDFDIPMRDPLKFKDTQKYRDRVKDARTKTGLDEAVMCGSGEVEGVKAVFVFFEFGFLGGSMGSAVGDMIARSIDRALESSLPLVIFNASGGARMQEGILSLMQMAKVSSTLRALKAKPLTYVSVLTDPTTGGVAASIAMLGDVIIAEPKALIGFAGPRVIEETIKTPLPEGFQRSEFLMEHGMIDMIVNRSNMRGTLENLLTTLRIN